MERRPRRGGTRTLKERVLALQRELVVLYLAFRDPRTPWYARAWIVLVLAYALSPIDLIPDFIPVLGLLDDLLLVPLGIWLALRLVPAGLAEELRGRAEAASPGRRLAVAGALLIGGAWLLALAGLVRLALALLPGRPG